MAKKSRLSDMHTDLKQDKPKKTAPPKEANAPRGERSEFLKVTITLPPDTWVTLKNIGTQRKAGGESDYDVSSLIRESLAEWLKRHN